MKTFFGRLKEERNINIIAILIGIVATCFFGLAYFVIGVDSYIEVHDQLDGEVLNYIYQAKYIFSGNDIIPEFMNGMYKSSMTVPAPLGIVFYLLLPPFHAFAFMHLFVLMVGYIGSYLLLKKITQNTIISVIVSCLFIYLPFYSVYGLSILGQPLLVWALWGIFESEKLKFKYIASALFYALSSSLALIGYAWLGVVFLLIFGAYICKKNCKNMFITFCGMLTTYLVTNISLVQSLFTVENTKYLVHREEMTIDPIESFWEYFSEVFFNGVNYAYSYNKVITALALIVIVLYPIVKKYILKEKMDQLYFGIAGVFALNVVIAILATLWHVDFVVRMRNDLGGFVKTFQLDRITWILPMCWYIVLALCTSILIKEMKKGCVGYLVVLVIFCLMGNTVYQKSTIYHNLRLMIFPDSYFLMGWEDYYATDVYQQIDEFIGEEKSSYRTVSLGLPPAAALYNGFYCLDGYSNFYSLEYKHQFRKIISKELDKQDELKKYFDQWGNRCYLLNSETGNYTMIDKTNTSVYENLEFDINQLKEMGAKYIFSGLQIINASEMGLELAREEQFKTEDSYFGIWLYKIVE